MLYCLSGVLGRVCCHSGERVCNRYSGDSSSGWGKVLGKEQIIEGEKLRGFSGSGRAVVHSKRVEPLKDKLMLKGIID